MEKSEFVQILRQDEISEKDFQPFFNAMYEQIWGNLLPPQILTDGLSSTIENNVITPKDAPVPDCMTCGACCASMVCVNLDSVNKVSSEDFWKITKQGENGKFTVDLCVKRKEEDFFCTALDGTVGEETACRIYEDRPKMCRVLEAGSDRCRAIRRAYSIEPFLDLMEMYEAVQKLKSQKENAADAERIGIVNISEEDGTRNLQINVRLKNGSEKVIHTFDPNCETWFQAEFEGLSVLQAEELILNKTNKV